MFRVLSQRWKQGYRTANYPAVAPKLSPRFLGVPSIDGSKCRNSAQAKVNQLLAPSCQECASVCPTGAMACQPLTLDLGRCLGCGRCAAVCPEKAIQFTGDYRMAVSNRQDLVIRPD